jgi:hypothetical protein
MDNTSLHNRGKRTLALAAPDPKVAILVVLASVVALYARNSKFDTFSSGSRGRSDPQADRRRSVCEQ